jgi:hypothetical protein
VFGQSNGTIQACYDTQNGQLRISPPNLCKPSEVSISWIVSVGAGSINTQQLADGAVTAAKIASGQVVKSLNGLTDHVTLVPGPNIAITPSGNMLVIGSTAPNSVSHDSTLKGDGSAGSPLGVNVPLVLTSASGTVISATSASGNGVEGIGSNIGVYGRRGNGSGALLPTAGIVGDSDGDGVVGIGLQTGVVGSTRGHGQTGVQGKGGGADPFAHAGIGVEGLGGVSAGDSGEDTSGGTGVQGIGGKHLLRGGDGVVGIGANFLVFNIIGGPSGGAGGNGIVGRAGKGVTPARDGLAGLFEGKVKVDGELVVSVSPGQRAGIFTGEVKVDGDLNVVNGTKNFMIDHPLDPANKYLIHAAIESSEVLNVYSGNVTTDARGIAVVALPDWFGAANTDLRYQLTTVGTFARAMVAEKVANNRFTIKTEEPNVEVSWQVTGVRADAALRNHPFKVEQDKPEPERGHYLSPAAFDQPEEKSIEWVRHPELMKQMKDRREAMKQQRPQQ